MNRKARCENPACRATFHRAANGEAKLCPVCRARNAKIMPTPAEIRAATAEIRTGWTPRDYRRRSGLPSDDVELKPTWFGY